MDDAERRAILREHGEEPPAKGKLGPDWVTRADALRADAPPPDGPGDDVTAADGPPEIIPTLPAERTPRRITTKAPSLRERFTRPRAPGKDKPKAKKKHPRVPVTEFVETVWAAMGGIVARADAPVGRTLIMQADAAGDILEDVVKGTVVDTALQPVVRNYQKGRKVAALAGPPMIVAAIEMAQRLPEDKMKVRMAILEPMLISSLMMWDEVSAERALERLERQEASAPRMEQAQRLARQIFAMAEPEPKPEPETVGV